MKQSIGPLLLVFLLGAAIPSAAEFGPEYGTGLEIIFYKYDNKPETELLYLYRTLRYQYFNDPAWSPDGKWIAFTGKISNGLWIVSSKGGKIILIDNENSGDDTEPDYFKKGYHHLCFTPDGQEITYETNVFDVKRGSVLTEVNNLT